MTNATKARAQRRRQVPEPQRRPPWVERAAFGSLGVVIVVAAAAIWIFSDRGRGEPAADAGPVHVHGLGVSPADGALFIATHTGLFRVGERETNAVRVGDSRQDTMGFTIAGEKRFLGSGHPDLRDDLPPLLGLIESADDGRSWTSISLLGETDFHVLRSAGTWVYGYDVTNDRFLASSDVGRTWDERVRPAPLLDLAVDPGDDERLLATGASDLDQGLYESGDGGRSWERIGGAVGLLAWPRPSELYLVDGSGEVGVSRDSGARFERRGSIGGQPAAFLGRGGDLYVALHDGTIKRSVDGGRTWTVRSTP